jgi:predicted ATPase
VLDRVYIDNFRCFSNFELKLAPALLVVGRNGSGKTSLWDVLGKLQDFLAEGVAADRAFPEASRTRWDTRSEQRFELDATVGGDSYRYKLSVRHEPTSRGAARTVVTTEELRAGSDVLYRRDDDGSVLLYGDRPTPHPRTTIPFDRARSFIPVIQPRDDNRRLSVFREFVERIQLVCVVPSSMEPVSPEESERLARDGSNFASWIRSQVADRPRLAAEMGNDLERCIAGYRDFKFEKIGSTARELTLDIQPSGIKEPVSVALRELSDGERVLLVLQGLMHCLEPDGLLFLDEPDNFLALEEVEPMLVRLREKAAQRGAQLVVASHNATAIDYLAASDTVELSRPGGGPARVGGLDFDREDGLRASEWLASHGAGAT